MTTSVLSIPDAVRGLRKALGLLQVDFAARVPVARETVSSWEKGRSTPTHEQRVAMARLLGDAPAALTMPIVEAFGIAPPKALLAAKSAGGAERAGRVLAVVRAAADELDVPASALRRTLGVVARHAGAAGVSLQEVAAVVGGGAETSAGVKARSKVGRGMAKRGR